MYQLSYWDALIWATARENDIPNVVTEDQEHARLIGEVRYLNPFSPAFEMSLLT
jgi:predicted nucleic acid-binding protein